MAKSSETVTRGGDTNRIPLGLGDLHASPGDHIGHFYTSKQELRALLVPFIRTGLARGDKCVALTNPGLKREELLEALGAGEVDVEGAIAAGQFVLDDGKSHPEELKAMLRRVLAEIPGSFPRLRWVGDMTWSLEKLPTTEGLMEWETHCNVVESPAAVFLCQYDLKAFPGNVVMDALKTHPLCIVSNTVHQNPYYESPDSFLDELRHRESIPLAPLA